MRLYEPAAYEWDRWPDSHWVATSPPPAPSVLLEGDARTDVAVIGAGYAGLNAALALRERGRAVTVLDAAEPGWGASGRNGGFCCMGGAKLSDAALVRRFGIDGARDFHRFQQDAVSHVAALLKAHAIYADQGPWGEVLLAHRPKAFAALRAMAEQRAELYGEHQTLVEAEELADLGLVGEGFHGALRNPVGFPLHPLKYAQGLARAARASGAVLHGKSPVTDLRRDGRGWLMRTPHGTLEAEQVLIATNGYSAENLPPWIGGRTLPVLSVIFVTRPLTAAEQAAQGWTSQLMSFDTRELLHYFRLLPDGRFLFGMRGGTSAKPHALKAVHARSIRHFHAMFPAWAGVEIESHWSGLACLTGSLTPFAGPVPEAKGLYAAFGWHGNGVSTASLAGARIGAQMTGEDLPLPSLLCQSPRRFPAAAFRRAGLALSYPLLAMRDGPLPYL